MMLERVLADAIVAAGIPGAVAMLGDRDGVRAAAVAGHRGDGGTMSLDTLFQLASMTKAVVSVAAMQLVAAGKLSLDAPIGEILPDLAALQVIAGFAEDGSVQLRPPVRPITLRHLLTHTSGFGYDFVQADMARARGPAGPPAAGTMASLRQPLLFDPGDDWAYGVSTDWVGLAVEAASGQRLDAYVAAHITGPLGMIDTGFVAPEGSEARRAVNMARVEDGTLVPFPINIGGGISGEFIAGGAGLWGTAADYMRFVRMLANGGSLDGVTILPPETVAEMARNQIGALRAGRMTTTMPALSLEVDWFPDMTPGWGLGFLINPETGPAGRPAGSLAWAGICNTFFVVDPASGRCGVLLMQLLPFADPGALAVLAAFEEALFRG
ncbi:MAG: serine hydrolase domain-containing protein [Polymorphobacter sp.]